MIISEQEKQIFSSSNVTEIMKAVLASEHETDQGREHFWTIGVNIKNIVQYIELVSLGTLTGTLVSPREVFRLAVMKGVAAIILCHNHPSGDLKPSQLDIELTWRLRNSGQILGIEVLDHVIIGKAADGFSFYGEVSQFREALHHGEGSQWHTENYPVSLRKKRAAKKKTADDERAVVGAAQP